VLATRLPGGTLFADALPREVVVRLTSAG